MRRMNFSLRFVLLLVAAIAAALGLWKLRPPHQLTLQLTAAGTAVVDGAEFQISSVPGVLNRSSAWRRLWFRSPLLVFQTDPSARYTDAQGIIEAAQNAEFKVSIAVVDPG